MKVSIISDIHSEFLHRPVKNTDKADVLILAGDIFVADDFRAPDSLDSTRYLRKVDYNVFLNTVSQEFEQVIYVAGNHEFYHGKWAQTIDILAEECSYFSNINFLERDTVIIDDVAFYGATLWTDIDKGDPVSTYSIKSIMNDYKQITYDISGNYRRLRPEDTINRHLTSIKSLDHTYKVVSKLFVVTHHAPSYHSIAEEWMGDFSNVAYASNLENFILDRPNITHWVHGHIHSPSDYMIGDTRVIANPAGYPGEFASSELTLKTIEI